MVMLEVKNVVARMVIRDSACNTVCIARLGDGDINNLFHKIQFLMVNFMVKIIKVLTAWKNA